MYKANYRTTCQQMFSKIPALKDFKLNLSGKTLEEHFRSKSSLKISSNINEVIKAVLNYLFFLRKDVKTDHQ